MAWMTATREAEPASSPAEFGIGLLWGTIREALIVAHAATEKIVLWNATATAIFGYDPDEAIGMPLRRLVPERLHDQHRRGIKRYGKTGRGRYIDDATILELPAVHRDGTELTIEMSLTPIEKAGDSSRYALALIRDVSDRKRLEQARQDFVAMVAHDIRSPLTVIIGCLSVMSNHVRPIGDKRLEEVIAVMEASAERASNLIDDLVKAARLESGVSKLASEPFDLGALVTDLVKQLMTAHPQRGFSVRLPSTMPDARGDQRGTARILENLLSNAIKFSADKEPIDLVVEVSDGMVAVSIRDRGPGIPQGKLGSIFNKFARSGRDPAAEGAGLGLYIAKLFAEGQNGAITVDSSKSGTTFTFTLPLTDV
jgi:PAS domain S-box-containing protein